MLKKIFSIRNDYETSHKIVTVLGINFKFKSKKLAVNGLQKKLKPILTFCKIAPNSINKGIIDVRIEKFKKHKSVGINTEEKRTPRIIVSLTSFPDRMYDIKYAIFSLLNQTVKPDKVILWLAESQFPDKELDIPDEVLSLREHGLTIAYTKDIRSYKKLIPSLEMYPNDIIVSADDDIYYPENWLELLYNEYLKDPNNVYAHRVHKIKFLNKNTLKPYMEWDRKINDNSLSLLNFPSTGGGILYPPHILYKDCLNEEIFMKLSPHSDEIWFWGMVILNQVKVKVVENAINIITVVNAERESFPKNETILYYENAGDNDLKNKQIRNMLEYYPELLKTLQNAKDIEKRSLNA